jgi:PLATZ transcription factor
LLTCCVLAGDAAIQSTFNWLDILTSTEDFFRPCKHCSATHSGRDALVTYFDLDDGAKLCNFCKQLHQGHRQLQIRRSSYHDVVKVADITRLYDIGGVQLYVINGDKVVFLRQRPQPRPPKGCVFPARCGSCSRQLMDDGAAYCCLRCKLEVEQLHYSKEMASAPAMPLTPQLKADISLPKWGQKLKRSYGAAMHDSPEQSEGSMEESGHCHSDMTTTAHLRVWAGQVADTAWCSHRGSHKRKRLPIRAPFQ